MLDRFVNGSNSRLRIEGGKRRAKKNTRQNRLIERQYTIDRDGNTWLDRQRYTHGSRDNQLRIGDFYFADRISQVHPHLKEVKMKRGGDGEGRKGARGKMG